MSVTLNGPLFASRLQLLFNAWQNAANSEDFKSLAKVQAIFLPVGDTGREDDIPGKSTALQTWLLGYEFPSTLTLFKKDKVVFLCSSSKAKILSQLKAANPVVPVEIHQTAKASQPPTDALPKLLKEYTSVDVVGHIAKETPSGKLITDWNASLDSANSKPELSDISSALAALLSVKDDEELKAVRLAANLTSTLLSHYVAPKLETILDKEAVISHASFAEQIESRLGSGEGENAKGPDMKMWSKGKGLQEIDWSSAEFVYSPILQSRSSKGGFDLRSTAQSSGDNIAHKGIFLIGVGMRYKGYCANLGRTFIVDPSKEQESYYELLLRLQADVLPKMRDGVPAKDVYNHAVSFLQKHKPELVKHLPKNIGFGMGLEYREAVYLLSGKNEHQLKTGMIFNLSLGLQDIDDGTGKTYALQLSDTIKITPEKGICLTEGTKQSKDVLFFLNAESEPEKKPSRPAAAPKGSPLKNKKAGDKILRGKHSGAAREDVGNTQTAKLAEHQRELHEQRQRDGLAKYSEEGAGSGGKEGKTWKRFQSYKGEAGLPPEVEDLRIHIDKKNQTVILPINGFAVPFHINAIKNAVKNDEGEYTLLRINLQTPGQVAGKKEDTPFEDPDATFVRSVSYRSTDAHRFDKLCTAINELKKEVTKREQQKKEMADVVEQDNLIEVKGGRPLKLPDVFMRPALDGKRLPGEVELHKNGVRYQSVGAQKLDILFSNIKHIFFQPCDNELLVILHVHLKAPIMIGKKKSKDVQFYREATDVQFDETGNRKRKYRYGDEDEIELEQAERRRRSQLNKEFKAYGEKLVEAVVGLTRDAMELDIPFRDLSFDGVPFRTNVKIQPSADCLLHLSDPPFLVVTIAEVEVVSLERVQFGLKQFDMVVIFSDFTKAPHHINSIPTAQLDDVKNWLDSVEIPFGESPVNLNWGPIMKTINEDPYAFFQGGGWNFLPGPSNAGESSDESDTASEYGGGSEGSVLSESSSDESSYAASNASDDEGSDFGDEDSDGDDWDELERKAAKSDKKKVTNGRAEASDSESDRPKKKASGKSNGKSKR